MNRHYPVDKSKRPLIEAKSVIYCPDCGAPVAVGPGLMDAHIERVHVQGPAKPIAKPVPRWEREW